MIKHVSMISNGFRTAGRNVREVLKIFGSVFIIIQVFHVLGPFSLLHAEVQPLLKK